MPAAYRLGEENQGWNVAMGTLANERVGTSGLSVSMRIELDNLIATARKHNPEALDDPGIRDRIARLWTQLELTRLLNARALSKILKGEKNWPEVPLAKLQWSYLSQTIAELGVDILGAVGRPGARRPRCRGQGALEPQLRVAALHVDRRGHDRGAEEHHRRPRHQDAPPLSRGANGCARVTEAGAVRLDQGSSVTDSTLPSGSVNHATRAPLGDATRRGRPGPCRRIARTPRRRRQGLTVAAMSSTAHPSTV